MQKHGNKKQKERRGERAGEEWRREVEIMLQSDVIMMKHEIVCSS